VEPIRYISTNRDLPGGYRGAVSFAEALQQGLAPDGGLYMPDRLPRWSPTELERLRGAPYAAVAEFVLRPFVSESIPPDVLRQICEESYDFEVPLEPLDDGVWILRLDRGPTASFKDFAARWMARALEYLSRGERHTVLVATSGDTGSAVGEAFRGLEGFRVFLLYPANEVSPVQKFQLDHIGENVTALAVHGTFDQCQALVKEAFLDPKLAPLRLTSANSINIGRILPQAVYYVYAWLQITQGADLVTFAVPSGNFGNSFGGELARRMGLPVARLILAVNANDEFPTFLRTGQYRPLVPSRACLSNAMNVGNPSNLARYFDWYGGILTREGKVPRPPNLEAMRRQLDSMSVDDTATCERIRRTWQERRVLLEPHGAVGVEAFYRLGAGPRPAVCLETAHPAKFPEVIESVVGFSPTPPPSFKRWAQRPPAVEPMEADYSALVKRLMRDV
jgi:threonine synthase